METIFRNRQIHIGYNRFAKEVQGKRNSETNFVSGKFDQSTTSSPYSAIRQAFTELSEATLVSIRKDANFKAIQEAVGQEASF